MGWKETRQNEQTQSKKEERKKERNEVNEQTNNNNNFTNNTMVNEGFFYFGYVYNDAQVEALAFRRLEKDGFGNRKSSFSSCLFVCLFV
jgi:hypothetical protein